MKNKYTLTSKYFVKSSTQLIVKFDWRNTKIIFVNPNMKNILSRTLLIVHPNYVSYPLAYVQTCLGHSFSKNVINTVLILREEKLKIRRV